MEQLYRWVKASERLPNIQGWYPVRQARFGEVGCIHEMHFNVETQKWYWQPNPNSICTDGFIFEWLEPIEESEQDELWNEIVSRIAAANLMASVTPGDVEAVEKWKRKAINLLSSKIHLIKR